MADDLPPRRTACDRCRNQKLGCIREADDASSTSCRRCLRAGAICATNATARVGNRASTQRWHRSRQVNTTRSGCEQQEAQVPTPASTLTGDCPGSCFSPSANEEPQQRQQRATSSVVNIADITGSGTTGASFEYRQFLNHDANSLDILDPSTLGALPPPLDTREECVRKLAGLHSTLVLDLTIVRGCQTADKCAPIINMPEFSQNYNFAVGRMLSGSAKLIEVLDYFSPPSSPHSQKEQIDCDVPTLYSILTCYAYLIRIYRTIFISIHKSILNASTIPTKLPPLFPGLHLGGFSLESQIDLQVKILVEVSETMLAKIENAIGLDTDSSSGLMTLTSVSGEILRLMLAGESTEKHKTGILVGYDKSLKEVLGDLKDPKFYLRT